MGHFTEDLFVRLTGDKAMPFQVTRTFEFHSGLPDSGLLIRTPEGFLFNGTSIPRGLRWLISPSDPELLQCAAAHDYGFGTGTMIITVCGLEKIVPVHRNTINALMSEMMIARRVKLWKRVMVNTGLTLGSAATWAACRARDPHGAIRTATTAF